MDFSVFPCQQAKKKPVPPPPAPAPPPPPPPKRPSFPDCIPEFMQKLPIVPGSRNIEMLFRWNFGDGMNGYYGQNPGYYCGAPIQCMMPGPFMPMEPLPPSHHFMGLPPPSPLLLGGMHGHGHPFGQGMHEYGHGHPFGQGMHDYDHPFGCSHVDYGFDPYGPPPRYY